MQTPSYLKKYKGSVTFIHFQDRLKYTFKTEANPWCDNQMYTYDNWGSCFASDWKHVQSILRGIYRKATRVIDATGCGVKNKWRIK
jgi:hypothetical protein